MKLSLVLATICIFASASAKEDEVEITDEIEVTEGDIVMTPKLKKFLNDQRDGKKISPFDAIVNGQWPNGRVPFEFSRSFPYASQIAVQAAINEYNAKTCIRFVPRTSSDRSYVSFFVGGGCYSMIGRQGGRQQISLGQGCGTKGTAIHEMMHALGFFHEQSRLDRDNYIRIMWNNIPSGVRYNFEKYKHGQADTLGEPYDKKSIMHYANYAFSNNRQKTIVSRSNQNEVLGQRNGLSVIDVKQLKKYYKCGGVTKPTTTTTERPPPTTSCKDNFNFCPTLASARLCSVSVSWVRDNCKKSCDKCPIEKPKCKNVTSHKNCGYWKGKGYCTSGVYVQWMGETCSICRKCR